MRTKPLWSRSKDSSKETNKGTLKDSKRLFLESCKILKQRREEYGITRNQLAKKTRITTTVLEAIENGWTNKLPEKAYLCSMLSMLELELDLERNSLDGILKGSKDHDKKTLLSTFNPGKLEILSSWQGSLLYVIIMLISIHTLNQQQRYMTKLNSQTIQPIVSDSESIGESTKKEIENISTRNLLGKSEIKKKQDSSWVNLILGKFKKKESFALLELNLNKESKVSIKSGRDYQTTINKVKGYLNLRLLSPVEIQIQPPPSKKDLIKWNGKNYAPLDEENGLYKLTMFN